MKLKIIVISIISLFAINNAYSKNKLDIKIFGGALIPQNSFAVFTQNKIINYFENDTILRSGSLKYVNSNTGYIVGISGIMNLTDDFKFTGSIEFHRINTFDNEIKKENNSLEFHPLNVFTTIIPISPGVMYYILDDKIGVYIKGEISYNMISYSMNYPIDDVQFDLPNSVSESRLGYSIGGGVDYFLDKVLVSLEYKLKNYNLIGKNTDEESKIAHLISIGFKF